MGESGNASDDIHYENIGRHSLKAGDSLSLDIASARAGYERVVDWTVPDSRDARGRYQRVGENRSEDNEPWDALRFANPFKFPMTTASAVVMEDGRFRGQSLSQWVNPGQTTCLRITRALSVRAESAEFEEEGQREIVWIGGNDYQRTRVKGRLTLHNYRGKEVTMNIRCGFSGKMLEADGNPKAKLRTEGVSSVNPRRELQWDVKIPAGGEKELAYRYEVDSISLLALRMLFSLPLFLLLAWWSLRKKKSRYAPPSRREWWQIVLLGILGYYLASLFDFLGLQYIGASLERLILFVYPTMVLILSAIFLRQTIQRDQYIALVLTYFGIALAFAGGIRVQDNQQLFLGGGLILISAFLHACYLIGSGRVLPSVGTLRFTSYAMIAASAGVLAHHGLFYQWRLFHFAPEVYQWSMLMAVLSTVLPAFMISEGIRLIGAGNAAIIGSVGPISTIVLAYIFLGERLTGWQWVGAALVISGVLWISLRKRSHVRNEK